MVCWCLFLTCMCSRNSHTLQRFMLEALSSCTRMQFPYVAIVLSQSWLGPLEFGLVVVLVAQGLLLVVGSESVHRQFGMSC